MRVAWVWAAAGMALSCAVASCVGGDDSSTADASSDVTSDIGVNDAAQSDATSDGGGSDGGSDAPVDAMTLDGGVQFSEFTIPKLADGGVKHPEGITPGPDGNMWFVEYDDSTVGKITPAGVITEYSVTGSYLAGIAAGSDGALWFTDLGQAHLGRITTAGSATYFDTSNGIECDEITNGPDDALWCGGFNLDAIARMAVDGGTVNYAILSSSSGLRGVASVNGDLWYGMLDKAKLGKMTTSGTPTEFPIPDDGGITTGSFLVAGGSDDNVWYTRYGPGVIARFTDAGTVTEFKPPSGSTNLGGLALAADGNLWFLEGSSNMYARITPAGTITEFSGVSPGAGLSRIAAGPNATVWFTEFNLGKIARITLP
jgi:virginiamycin B lyase